MPRQKKVSKRGNLQGASRGGGRGGRGDVGRRPVDTSFVPFAGTSTPRKDHGFTLQEEARNTERHQSFWNTDQRLRDTKVSFISAGKFEPTKSDEPENALADMTLGSPKQSGGEEEGIEDERNRVEDAQEEALESTIKASVDTELFDFVIDIHGSEPVQTGIPPPKVRSTSPTPSDSSEEIILFRGRDQLGRGLSRPPPVSRKLTDPIEEKIKMVEEKIHKKTELLAEVLRHEDTPYSSVPHSSRQGPNSDFGSILPRTTRARRGRRNRPNAKNDEEDALIADYIANMDEDDVAFNSFNRRDLGGMEDEFWQDTEASSGEPIAESSRVVQGGWNYSDIEDFDDLSTSDGVMGEVQAILSKRERSSGSQYLVVWEHQSTDEARWVPATTLTSVPAMIHIESFEAEEKLVAEFKGNEEEDTSDSEDSEIEVEEEDDDSDGQDLIQRKIDRMSDERMMRLLSKQEELGLGSAELLLIDADEADDVDADEEMMLPRSNFRSALHKSRQAKPLHGISRARGDFPSATMFAAAYDGFDVMDFDRPSLQKKPRGRKGKLVLDISDSDLEGSMQMAWTNDRLKKKERKQEREELRAKGLLGSKNGKVNMKDKYKEGMGIHAVKEEIKAFLMGGNTTLALPPMDKADRKIVHELANAFCLKSKSAGNGSSRFPILYRTSKTRAFNDSAFDAIDARLSRRFLPRMDVGGKKVAGARKAGGGGGFNNAAVSYRDGDIVGGSAPELGAENRGRAMLEKMGWSSGTALGALNNKGILQPVSHVVKTGKAGLG